MIFSFISLNYKHYIVYFTIVRNAPMESICRRIYTFFMVHFALEISKKQSNWSGKCFAEAVA